jgi:hypothetical protein
MRLNIWDWIYFFSLYPIALVYWKFYQLELADSKELNAEILLTVSYILTVWYVLQSYMQSLDSLQINPKVHISWRFYGLIISEKIPNADVRFYPPP